MTPWPIFAVEAYGYTPEFYTKPTRAKAMWRAFQDFTEHRSRTFHEFLVETRIWKTTMDHVRAERLGADGYDYVRDVYGVFVSVGDTVELSGEGSTRNGKRGLVLYPGRSTAHVHCQVEGVDRALIVHPSDVTVVERRRAAA